MEIGEPTVYEEKQRFKRIWSVLFLLQLILIGMAIFDLIIIIVLPTGLNISNPNQLIFIIPILLVVFVIVSLIVILLYILELTTIVTSGGIYYKFYPFQLEFRKIEFEDIKQCYARKYRPILEYGGWGIRYSLWSGKAYNVRGNEGLQLVLSDGSMILFGSQTAKEFEGAIKSAGGKRLVLEERVD